MDDEEKVAALETELAELRPLKDTSAKLQEEFKSKEDAWIKEKADLEQAANPNWKKTREQIAALRSIAEKGGTKFDEEGNVISEDKVNRDEIIKEAQERATQSTRQEFLNNRLDELLEDYGAEEAKVVRHYYAKLTAGEEVTMQNIKTFVSSSINASGFEQPSKINRAMSMRGGSPRPVNEGAGLSDEGAAATAALMGLKIKTQK